MEIINDLWACLLYKKTMRWRRKYSLVGNHLFCFIHVTFLFLGGNAPKHNKENINSNNVFFFNLWKLKFLGAFKNWKHCLFMRIYEESHLLWRANSHNEIPPNSKTGKSLFRFFPKSEISLAKSHLRVNITNSHNLSKTWGRAAGVKLLKQRQTRWWPMCEGSSSQITGSRCQT